jgi:hypothetical protein
MGLPEVKASNEKLSSLIGAFAEPVTKEFAEQLDSLDSWLNSGIGFIETHMKRDHEADHIS